MRRARDIQNIKPNMINFSINVPQIFLQEIDKRVKLGYYPSRSEAVRIAIREWIVKPEYLQPEEEEEIKEEPVYNEYGEEVINLGGRVLTIGRRSQ